MKSWERKSHRTWHKNSCMTDISRVRINVKHSPSHVRKISRAPMYCVCTFRLKAPSSFLACCQKLSPSLVPESHSKKVIWLYRCLTSRQSHIHYIVFGLSSEGSEEKKKCGGNSIINSLLNCLFSFSKKKKKFFPSLRLLHASSIIFFLTFSYI